MEQRHDGGLCGAPGSSPAAHRGAARTLFRAAAIPWCLPGGDDHQDADRLHGLHGRRCAPHARRAQGVGVDAGSPGTESRGQGMAAAGRGRAQDHHEGGDVPGRGVHSGVRARARDGVHPRARDLGGDPVRRAVGLAVGHDRAGARPAPDRLPLHPRARVAWHLRHRARGMVVEQQVLAARRTAFERADGVVRDRDGDGYDTGTPPGRERVSQPDRRAAGARRAVIVERRDMHHRLDDLPDLGVRGNKPVAVRPARSRVRADRRLSLGVQRDEVLAVFHRRVREPGNDERPDGDAVLRRVGHPVHRVGQRRAPYRPQDDPHAAVFPREDPVLRVLLHVDPLDAAAVPVRPAHGARMEDPPAAGADLHRGHGECRAWPADRRVRPGIMAVQRWPVRAQRGAGGHRAVGARSRAHRESRVLPTRPAASGASARGDRRAHAGCSTRGGAYLNGYRCKGGRASDRADVLSASRDQGHGTHAQAHVPGKSHGAVPRGEVVAVSAVARHASHAHDGGRQGEVRGVRTVSHGVPGQLHQARARRGRTGQPLSAGVRHAQVSRGGGALAREHDVLPRRALHPAGCAVHRCDPGAGVRGRDHGGVPVRHHAAQPRPSLRARGCAQPRVEARGGFRRPRAHRRGVRAHARAGPRVAVLLGGAVHDRRRRRAHAPERNHHLHVRRAHAQRRESRLRGVRPGAWRRRAGVRLLRHDRCCGRSRSRARDHHRVVPSQANCESAADQSAEGLMLLIGQEAATAAQATSALSRTAAQWLWAVPLLPLLGFVLDGALALVGSHLGPADPSAAPHDDASHAGGGHPAGAHDTAHDTAHDSAHGDDHHVVARHRFAALPSISGPAVLMLAFLLSAAIFWQFRAVAGDMHQPYVQRYFSWIPAGDLRIDAALMLDQLSLVMVLVVTGVGTLIHVFSVGYMRDDPSYPRYFAYLNLFVFFMLLLVLGANYPVLFVGWEGVGLCSYLLIGFWFSEKVNADAGKKAFIVNRIGDFGFMIAMFMLFANYGTLDFHALSVAVGQNAVYGGALVTTICLFLFLGCTGKSAQIPLYVWLPDAMAGPTPVSALIHAATMVTAGVYLIARSHFLFAIAPVASLTVVVIGALTAVFAATIGLKQWDIKKVLAYSTVSQLGYMFVGVGAGAYSAGIFHLITHAFFKALLFLGSGSAIFAMHRAYHATHS